MQHITFGGSNKFEAAVLVKGTALKDTELLKYYVNPLKEKGIKSEKVVAFDLYYEGKKCPVGKAKAWLAELLPELRECGVTHIYVCDAVYFKILAGVTKAEANYGYKLPCAIKDYEDMTIIIGGNYQGLYYNPDLQQKIDLSINCLADDLKGQYQEIGTDIIHHEYYPTRPDLIKETLNKLHQYPALTCDIETFSLKFWEAGISTISFAWSQHEGIAFPVDYLKLLVPKVENDVTYYGKQRHNPIVKKLLLEFFLAYKGKLIYQNGNFDIKVLIYELFMEEMLDQKGMLHGLEVMTRCIDDTKLITYLATNSTAGNTLGLKENAHEFAGNYAQSDIKDNRLIPLDTLLRYNLVDCLSTWYVHNKNYPIMLDDEQKGIYDTIKIPSVKLLLQVELTGMPMCMSRVAEVKELIQIDYDKHQKALMNTDVVKDFVRHLRQKESDACHAKWKVKTAPIEHFDYVEFNPGSPLQLQDLLYNQLKFPVIDKTKSKQPATGAKTLKKLGFLTDDPLIKDMLKSLIGMSKAGKILTTFIVAFENNTVLKSDGHYYLHGSFNLGGTVSGRLSSSQPNLQNIPSGSTYAKLIKSCFVAPDGWLFMGCDFASLEDRISALTTKDPNKLKVYQGHIVYELSIDGTCHHIRDDATIEYDGKTYTGGEFYALYGNT